MCSLVTSPPSQVMMITAFLPGANAAEFMIVGITLFRKVSVKASS